MVDDKDSKKLNLESLRKQIDELDAKIVELLNRRARVVVDIGKSKQQTGAPVYAPDREQAVLDRLEQLNEGPLPQKSLNAIYRELMSGSFALEKPLRIGFLGPLGSFSHLCSMRKFGASVEHRPLPDIRGVFAEVAAGHCDLGLVPIENSLGGGVIDTMDCFIDSQLHIIAEVLVEIHHNLLANCPPEKIRLVASKPEVFAQCRNWLSTGLSGVELVPVASSSKAAEMAAAESNMAAIGSELAAELYGLRVVYANIEDSANNQTRFFVISSRPANRSGNDKTSLLLTTAHKVGALSQVLDVFAHCGVNLTSIGSRPSKRRNWEYYFFVDIAGHMEDENVKQALAEVKTLCNEMIVLGSYPCAAGAI